MTKPREPTHRPVRDPRVPNRNISKAFRLFIRKGLEETYEELWQHILDVGTRPIGPVLARNLGTFQAFGSDATLWPVVALLIAAAIVGVVYAIRAAPKTLNRT